MVALVAARGVFHVAQEGVHFGQGELAAGADGAVAGHGGEDVVFVFFDGLAAADLGEFAQDVFGGESAGWLDRYKSLIMKYEYLDVI